MALSINEPGSSLLGVTDVGEVGPGTPPPPGEVVTLKMTNTQPGFGEQVQTFVILRSCLVLFQFQLQGCVLPPSVLH